MGKTGSNNQKKPPRTLWYYYGIVCLIVLLFNWLIMPMILSSQVRTTTYSDFMDSLEADTVLEVQFSETEIRYTTEENGRVRHFKTGVVDNPQLPQRLQERNSLRGRNSGDTESVAFHFAKLRVAHPDFQPDRQTNQQKPERKNGPAA